jgi:formylglycine-generating enzyme required for sulfatase activity
MYANSILERDLDAQKGSVKSTSGQTQISGSLIDKGSTVPALPLADTLPPGLANLPNYEIKQELGRGGMGVVYLAHNKLMGRDEVLKVMGRHIIECPGMLDRFLREIRVVAKLRHPNIVTAYSAVRLGQCIVFAMEYVEGLDLSKLVKAEGPMPVADACLFAHQAALGLQHAHEKGLVHRDIKPHNLMLTHDGDRRVVKILDFGLAKVTREEKVDGGLTSEGQALGTPDYIAPEQILGSPSVDVRADIYSLGGTLYYLLTGRPPFKANSLYDIYQAHISRDADPLNTVRPEVPSELAALVAKMLAKDPARRFQRPVEVAQALTPYFQSGTLRAKEEISRTGLAGVRGTTAGETLAPTHPTTNAQGQVAPLDKTAEFSARESRCECLTEAPDAERTTDTLPVAAPARRPPSLWPSAVAGGLLLASIVACGVVLNIKTQDGVIELINLPKGAKVFVDGEEVSVSRPDGDMPAVVTAKAGRRNVKVQKDRIETYNEEVTVLARGVGQVTIPVVPLTASNPERGDGYDRTARPEDAGRQQPPARGRAGAVPVTPTPMSAADRDTSPSSAMSDKAGSANEAARSGDVRATPPREDTLTNGPPETLGRAGEAVGAPASALEGPARTTVGRPTTLTTHDHSGGMAAEIITTRLAGIELKRIPAGGFMMGSFDEDKGAEAAERPRHFVRITRAFYLGVTEVTQGQYRAVTGQSPSAFKGSDNLPVENVTWFDAVNFCNELSRKEGLPAFYRIDGRRVDVNDWGGAGYRLPTEAEWEYACRARGTTRYSSGEDEAGQEEYAWYLGNSGRRSHRVGQKRPNAFGLYDTRGNVREWCWDWFDKSFYSRSTIEDPVGPLAAERRVNRGGGWEDDPMGVRLTYRAARAPEERGNSLGFRLARVESSR